LALADVTRLKRASHAVLANRSSSPVAVDADVAAAAAAGFLLGLL
jgi:hypothetical protein